MRKAKTKRNLISILSAALGVVFAFITGMTYCFNLLEFRYSTNPNSTSAYLGNQQYVMINDTIDCPVAFGEGTHNFEIAMQYAISYDFDVRLRYSMQWSNGKNVDNVILHFANKDNVIYDNEYIYLANSVPAGEGKVVFITGVDFVDVNDDNYFGQNLTINILGEKIYKSQTEYDENHYLYKDAFYAQTSQLSLAAQMWLANKPKTEDLEEEIDLNNANVLMYNYRSDYSKGIPYSGHNTAYKRNVSTSQVGDSTISKTTNSTWLGGNRAYAGTGMYVVTGNKAIKITIKVEGVWYSAPNIVDNSDLISENSIKYHYSNGWTNQGWFNNKMWEIRSFDYIIPANSARYINVLDSIEITSASKNQDTLAYDTYRMVTNKITVNAGGNDVLFDYTTNTSSIRKSELTVDTTTELTGNTYSQGDVEIVNKSLYSMGLYETVVGTNGSEQSFNTNISLINNTPKTKTVTLVYKLYYYISNGSTGFIDGNGYRAEEYVKNGTWTDEYALSQNLCYGYAVEAASGRLTSAVKTSVVVGPYSSVKLLDNYKVAANLQTDVQTTNGSQKVNYDVWTYLDVQVAKSGDNELVVDTPSPATANLTIETQVSGNTVTLSVKNNTNSTISGIEISSFSIEEMTKFVENDQDYYTGLEKRPNDWVASYWKYYKREKIAEGGDLSTDEDDTFKYTQLTSDPLAGMGADYFPTEITYYEKDKQYFSPETAVIQLHLDETKFSKSGSTITNKVPIILQHGESVVFATATTTQTSHVMVKGYATSSNVTASSTLMLINNGTADAYLINHSENSYFVRFTGTLNSAVKNFEAGTVTINDVDYTHNYYIGIVRPGQIIPVPMLNAGELTEDDMFAVTGDFNETALTNGKWSPRIIELLTKYFALIKTA